MIWNYRKNAVFIVNDGVMRMFYLATVFDENAPLDSRKMFLQNLTRYGGEWGRELGDNILLDNSSENEMKLAAGVGMVEAGYYSFNEPIPAVVDGKDTAIEIRSVSMEGPTEGRYKEARDLFQQGKIQEAATIIEDDLKSGAMYPPELLLLARVYHTQGQKELLEAIMPVIISLCEGANDSLLYLDLVQLLVYIGEYTQAASYVNLINQKEIPPEYHGMLDNIMNNLLFCTNDVRCYFHEEEERENIENKSLPLSPTLLRGFKNMPVGWINVACDLFDIDPARRRKDREKQLKEFLLQEDNLRSVIRGLSPDAFKLLCYIMGKEGWSRINVINKKFGSMEGDGFWWEAELPESALGELWCRKLIFVGRTVIDKRNTKIATIPIDLKPILEKLLPS